MVAEYMNRERAETYLRLLAEAALRCAAVPPADGSVNRWRPARLDLIGEALRAVGAIEVGLMDQVRQDLDLALAVREPGPRRKPGRRGLTRDARMHLVSMMHHPPPRAGPRESAVPFFSTAHDSVASRLVPLGQVIRVCADGSPGEMHLLAFAQTPNGARLMIGWRSRSPVAAAGPFRKVTAVDDRATSYRLSFRGWAGTNRTELEGALDLRPNPPSGIRWLDISAAPGEPATRVDLAWAIPPLAANPPVTLTGTTVSPGELLLNGIAARILARAEPIPAGTIPAGAARLKSFPHAADGLGAIIAALQAAGALSPLSPVPGQVARLCAALGISGHGITAPPAGVLPEPWQGMLTDDRAPSPATPARTAWAATAVELPELDGARIAFLGLHQSDHSTILNIQASGVEMEDDWLYIRGIRPLPVLWIRDHTGRWHTMRSVGMIPQHDYGAVMMRMAIIPPLDPDTPRVEVVATAASGEARLTLRLRWL